MTHYTYMRGEKQIHFSRVITINLKFGAICKRSKTRMKLSMVRDTNTENRMLKRKETEIKKFQQRWKKDRKLFWIYHSISHIKRIFKWLPSHLIENF